jgi:hypothetical protein
MPLDPFTSCFEVSVYNYIITSFISAEGNIVNRYTIAICSAFTYESKSIHSFIGLNVDTNILNIIIGWINLVDDSVVPFYSPLQLLKTTTFLHSYWKLRVKFLEMVLYRLQDSMSAFNLVIRELRAVIWQQVQSWWNLVHRFQREDHSGQLVCH